MAEVIKSLDEIYKSNLHEYYTGNHVDVFFNNIYVDECTSIGFRTVVNNAPVYAYNEELFKAISQGNFRVEGRFSVNFVANGYVEGIIQKGDEARENGEFSPLGRLSPIATTLSEKSTTSSLGNLNLNDPKFLNTVVFDPTSTALTESEKRAAKNALRDYIWGNYQVTEEAFIKSMRDVMTGRYFDILIMIGNPNTNSYDVKNIVSAQILDVTMEVVKAMPLQLMYTFIAQDMDRPTSRPNPFNFFQDSVPSAKSLELLPAQFLDSITELTQEYTRVNILNTHTGLRNTFANDKGPQSAGRDLYKIDPTLAINTEIVDDSIPIKSLAVIDRASTGETVLGFRKATEDQEIDQDIIIKRMIAPLSLQIATYDPKNVTDFGASVNTTFSQVAYGGISIPAPNKIDISTKIIESDTEVNVEDRDKAIQEIVSSATAQSSPKSIFDPNQDDGIFKDDADLFNKVSLLPDSEANAMYYKHTEPAAKVGNRIKVNEFNDRISKISAGETDITVKYPLELLDPELDKNKNYLIKTKLIELTGSATDIIDATNTISIGRKDKSLDYIFKNQYTNTESNVPSILKLKINNMNGDESFFRYYASYIPSASSDIGDTLIINIFDTTRTGIQELIKLTKDGYYYIATDLKIGNFKIEDNTNNDIRIATSKYGLHICVRNFDFSSLIPDIATLNISEIEISLENRGAPINEIVKNLYQNKTHSIVASKQYIDLNETTNTSFTGYVFDLSKFKPGESPTDIEKTAYALAICQRPSNNFIPCKINNKDCYIIPFIIDNTHHLTQYNITYAINMENPTAADYLNFIGYLQANIDSSGFSAIVFEPLYVTDSVKVIANDIVLSSSLSSPQLISSGVSDITKMNEYLNAIQGDMHNLNTISKTITYDFSNDLEIYKESKDNNVFKIFYETPDINKIKTCTVYPIQFSNNLKSYLYDATWSALNIYVGISILQIGNTTVTSSGVGIITDKAPEYSLLAIDLTSEEYNNIQLIYYKLIASHYYIGNTLYGTNDKEILNITTSKIQMITFSDYNEANLQSTFKVPSIFISDRYKDTPNDSTTITHSDKPDNTIRNRIYNENSKIFYSQIVSDYCNLRYNGINRFVYQDYIIGELFKRENEISDMFKLDMSDSRYRGVKLYIDNIPILRDLIYTDANIINSAFFRYVGYNISDVVKIIGDELSVTRNVINNNKDPYYKKFLPITIYSEYEKNRYLLIADNVNDTIVNDNNVFYLEYGVPRSVPIDSHIIENMVLLHKQDNRTYEQILSDLHSVKHTNSYKYFIYEATPNKIYDTLKSDFPQELQKLNSTEQEVKLLIMQVMHDFIRESMEQSLPFTSGERTTQSERDDFKRQYIESRQSNLVRNSFVANGTLLSYLNAKDSWDAYIRGLKNTGIKAENHMPQIDNSKLSTVFLIKTKPQKMFEDIFQEAGKYNSVTFKDTVSTSDITNPETDKYLLFETKLITKKLDKSENTICYSVTSVNTVILEYKITKKEVNTFTVFRDMLLKNTDYDIYSFKIELLTKDSSISQPHRSFLQQIKDVFIDLKKTELINAAKARINYTHSDDDIIINSTENTTPIIIRITIYK